MRSPSQALLASAPELSPVAAYNLGNTLYQTEKYEEAAAAYRRSLLTNPEDLDAKRNLELALRALEQQQQQPQQEQQPEQQPENEEGEEDKDQKEQQQPEQQSEPSDEDRPQDQERQQEPREDPGAMTAQEAGRLLDSLDEQEREAQRRRVMREAQKESKTAEEDW